jgi:4-amino-4-deoxy-L-arabinose transferase-like glycosyltransferase
MLRTGVLRFATPFTAGLFLVAVVSGVALFFRLGTRYFFDMHVWLSLLLLVPFALHLWRNWSSLIGYLRGGRLALPLVVCGLLGVAFVVPAMMGQGGGDPGFVAFNLLLDGPLKAVAPLVHRSAEEVATQLRAKGYVVVSINSTLGEIASKSGRDPPDVLADVVAMGQSGTTGVN